MGKVESFNGFVVHAPFFDVMPAFEYIGMNIRFSRDHARDDLQLVHLCAEEQNLFYLLYVQGDISKHGGLAVAARAAMR